MTNLEDHDVCRCGHARHQHHARCVGAPTSTADARCTCGGFLIALGGRCTVAPWPGPVRYSGSLPVDWAAKGWGGKGIELPVPPTSSDSPEGNDP